MVTPAAQLGQLRQKWGRIAANANRGQRDAILIVQARYQVGNAGGVSAAICEQDDMLDQGRVIGQDVRHCLHAGQDIGAAADLDRANGVDHGIGVIQAGHGHHPCCQVIEGDHTDPVGGGQQLNRAHGRFFGQLQLGDPAVGLRHAARVIYNEDNSQ